MMRANLEKYLSADGLPVGKVIPLLPIIFAYANLLRLITGAALPYLAIMMLAGGLGILLLGCRQIVRADRLPVIVITAVFVLFGVLNMVLIGNADLGSVVTEVMMFGSAFLLLSYPHNTRWGTIAFYGFVAIYGVYWIAGVDPKDIMRSSNNYVSVVLLIGATFYYTALERNGGKIDSFRKVLPAILCVPLAGWARGRAGILACGILLIGILLLLCKSSSVIHRVRCRIKKTFAFWVWWKTVLAVFLGVVLIAVVCIVLKHLGVVELLLGKFITRGFKNVRPTIWGDYLRHCLTTPGNLILGAPLMEVPIVAKFSGNLHNSLLQIYADHGLIVFLLMICLLVFAAVYFYRKKMHVHLLMILVFCIRAFFDKFVSMQYGMMILAYFMLYPFFGNPSIMQKLISRKTGEPFSNGK